MSGALLDELMDEFCLPDKEREGTVGVTWERREGTRSSKEANTGVEEGHGRKGKSCPSVTRGKFLFPKDCWSVILSQQMTKSISMTAFPPPIAREGQGLI